MSTEQTKISSQPLLAECLKTTFSAWKDDSKWLDPRYSASYLSKFFHLSLLSKELKHAYTWSHFNSRLFTVVDCWIGAFPTHPKLHLYALADTIFIWTERKYISRTT